jgi:hypothetical protein
MKRYPVYLVLAIALSLLLAACGDTGGSNGPSFAKYTAQDGLNALGQAGLSVQGAQSDTSVGRGAPSTFSARLTFIIADVAPNGGQVLSFNTQADMQAWQDYIDGLKRDPATRRDVTYTYFNHNLMLQINANLIPPEAAKYQAAFMAMP